ncbi:hypothetical protein GGU10DRAFT_384123 [Lentinula aff. detonsa]|uniref:S-adenosyl-L-methionine-dependent methyltransferase n=1 Tax=Lentinula aff. detonsa TaxID=2804958 RepID=A0AA38NQX5_9AGAR|nr:hypothetical protein GGU10DRAFT_384123 [Lentinula aff. detonsa]
MPDLSSPAIDPPTSYLPSIKSLSSFTENHRLHDCIVYLRQIYVPNVRGSRRRKPKQQNPSNISFSIPHPSPITTIRKDPFERAYALRWLSALTRLEPPPTDSSELADIQNAAAALLAICAGTASAGTVQRRCEFAGGRIQIALNDVPLSTDASNGDYFGSVGAQTWGGAFVLAEEIADNSIIFFPDTAQVDVVPEVQEPFRVLELGAGTGLVSLVAGKVAMLNYSGRQVDIIATDYYPSVLDNLKANIEANFSSSISSLNITSRFLDWSSFSSFDITPDADASLPPNNIGTFDLILGADIIYEPLHASWIRRVVENTLRKSSLSTEKNCPDRNNGGGQGLFHLVIPLRPSFVAESSTIEQEFRFVGDKNNNNNQDGSKDDLVILSREIILCDADEDDEEADIDLDGRNSVSEDTRSQVGEGNIVRYVYYIIGWEG